MSEPKTSRASNLLRAVFLGCVCLAAGAVLVNLALRPSGAGAAPESMTPAAYLKTKDQLLITIGLGNPQAKPLSGKLAIEIVGQDGTVLVSRSQQVELNEAAGAVRFELPAGRIPVEAAELRFQYGNDEQFKVPLKDIMVAKAHETTVRAGQEFHSGSLATVRCGVHGVKSLSETIPLAGADVEIRLKPATGQEVALFKGKAGDQGVADAQFKVPSLPEGNYTLVVATRSDLGEEKLEQPVRVKAESKIMLVTDKPLYQPGQLMHLRALVLRPFDLTPEAQSDLTFEVEDAKGNKVFKKTLKTSEHGIAAADFQLADEVNMGDYRIRALLGNKQADKTVAVKKYVLPKFKIEVKSDKRYYLPKETVHVEVQSDYFFGKPTANAKIKLTASTFDVEFRQFKELNGTTDANGHAKFDVELPATFIGQPLAQGNALVKLDVKLTDTADHSETATKTYPVSNQAINFSLIPEGGRLVPGVENRVFAAATYPDGSPTVNCEVQLWLGNQAKDQPFATLKTNDAGLAEFKLTPKAEQFRQDQNHFEPRNVEMLGGQVVQVGGGPRQVLDLTAKTKDAKGSAAQTVVALTADPQGDNVLLRLDKAIYKGGDTLKAEVLTTAGMPTVYLDIVRGGQTMLSRWMDAKDGKASHQLDLPANVFGTLEIHAYQMLATGEVIRDSRVAYVHPRDDLKIEVKADKDVYQPGADGQIRFQVTDSKGQPTPAALGVIIVDEAVYALQDLQPGMEKVFFTLQEELLKPQVQVIYKPSDSFDTLVREPAMPADKQQIAQALLAGVRPKPPARWEVNPALQRQQQAEAQLQQIGHSLFQYAGSGLPYMERDGQQWKFRPDLLKEMSQTNLPYNPGVKFVHASLLFDVFGQPLKLADLARLDQGFTADRLAAALTLQRLQQVQWGVVNHANQNQGQLFKNGEWTITSAVLADAARQQGLDAKLLKDAWGTEFRLYKQKAAKPTGFPVLDQYEIVSAGPDGQFNTADDVKLASPNDPKVNWVSWWWLNDVNNLELKQQQLAGIQRRVFLLERGQLRQRGGLGVPVAEEVMMDRAAFGGPVPAMAPGGGFAGGEARELRAMAQFAPKTAEAKKDDGGPPPATEPGGGPPVMRVREYFPETLLWRPALITDDQGRVTMPLNFADSITTWRLSASASSKGGLLGGTTASLRVFQDFFVDLDLPVTLTQNDEVAFPVAVYNYLKTPQTVKLDLVQEPWFELLDEAGPTRSLDLKPNEVTAVKFRIKAKKVGYQPLTVKAAGSKLSDAIKRVVEVVPDGQKVEVVLSDKLQGKITQRIEIPEHAVADASKLIVKVYPGVMAQVIEGAEGMLRMPHGCFEQTSSAAYPNILVVDYIKKTRMSNPQLLAKAEQFLNVGYQKLLTFEKQGGGFSWWPQPEPPLVWLSAYGLQEFSDMAKVYPVDRGVIERTQNWLMSQQNKADGTWSNIGMTHGESIERMGDPKLLLTSYVTWSLLDSGVKAPGLEKSIEYIRTHVKKAENPYILALAANALAAYDAKDDSTFEVLKRLEKMKVAKPDWQAVSFPTQGQSLAYARGDCATIETTALATLAMIRSGQFSNTVNQAMVYLVKSRDGSGTWGSTQATILALKALLAGMGGSKQEGKATFSILVNGQEAGKGEVTKDNADVLQLFDLKEVTKVGVNEVEIKVQGETNLIYQIVGRYFEPWKQEAPAKPVIDVNVAYDRTELATSDLLKAKATLKYHGEQPTYMVIVDLGIPPGFTVDPGDFAEMVGAKKVEKFSVTARTVTLYLGDVKPGDVKTFDYTLKPKYPIKAKTPATVAYEYNTPANRAAAKPVELTVVEQK
ncbi:MAG: hypothetical protein JNM56_36890 [Planctomycetia bacterium]|nr:hypothetical protein [Planctomycetia bacterium]